MLKDSTVGADARAGAMDSRLLEAVGYLTQCRESGRSFAVLTGPNRSDIQAALHCFLAELPPGCRVARLPAPTDSSHSFLEAVLAQFGFEPFDSTAEDLQRLLTVILRQGWQTATLIVVEDAQDFGPRVLETIRELARNARDTAPAPLIVLTGHAGLNRVLDSKGMGSIAAMLRVRFDLEEYSRALLHSSGWYPAADTGPAISREAVHPVLELSLNNDIVGRFPLSRDRLLIGRSQLSDICIASRFISRQHALLVRNPDGDWLIDLNSTNGTSVNSQLVHHRRLEHGDVISIGNYRLRYDSPSAETRSTPALGPDDSRETEVMRTIAPVHELPQREDGMSEPSAA